MTYNYRRKHINRLQWLAIAIPAVMAGLVIGFIIAVHIIYWILATSVLAASHG